jgi:transposase
MKSATAFAKCYLHREAVDFRKWIDGLAAIVKAEMQLDPYGAYVFAFTNRRRDKIKCLYWDRTGYAIWYKRLEEQRFQWPKRGDETVVTLTPQQFDWLLDGYDVTRMRPHETLSFAASF